MEVFDEELAQYGILAKNAQKLIEKERVCVFGNAEIETIDIKILQEKGIAHLHIMDSEFKGALSVQDGYLNFNFSNVSFMNTVAIRGVSFDYLILRQCTFKNIFVLDQVLCKNEISFFRTKFNKLVHFVNSDFGGKVNFTEIEFLDRVDFNNIEVKNHINLFNLMFWKVFKINIARLSNLTIAKTVFQDKVIFLEVGVENIVHICDVKFENKTTFNIKEFGKLEFLNNQVLGEIDFTKSSGKKALIKKSSFKGNVILGISLENLSLVDLNFKEVSLFINNFLYTQNIKFIDIIFEKLFLQKELFEKSVNFERCIFLQDVNFKDHTFNEIAFNTCTFKESAYFNNSNFTKGVDFHECEFEKTACFYGVKFDETPNFSQALFKGNINIINSNLNFDFTKLDKKIRLLSSQGEGKYDYEIANDFRDSFRNFKSALIKDNNFLDASNFHKYELYCKELELKNKKATTFKDIVDRYQLLFYRKLCDHHTDLLKAFHNLLIVIMLFGMFSFALDKFKQPSHIENDIKYNIVKVDSNENYIFKEHNKTTYNLLSLNIEQDIQDLNTLLSEAKFHFVFGFSLLVIFIALLNKKYLWLLFLPLFWGTIYCIGFPISMISHFLIILLFVCIFVFIMIFDSKAERFLFVGISYTVCIFTLLVKPSLLLPALGSFLDKDSNATYPLLLSLSVVYFMLVVLVLFSLQKTARKNSIVPS
ncbi:TPA: pentapeptide repeat-containing protein [Campylobacter coli]|nr:pentapeptide repeat-containing protein [Campylobacter coli]